MGADMHYTIETKGPNGQWCTLFDSGLRWTAWFGSRFIPEGDIYERDTYGLSALRDRNYSLFGLLSAVRIENPFAGDLGTEDGVANIPAPGTYGWPADISEVAKTNLPDANPDYHSHGWMTLADTRAMAAFLKAHGAPVPDEENEHSDASYAKAAGLEFCSDFEVAVGHLMGLNGDAPLIGFPIGAIPDDDSYDDPNADVGGGISAHETLAFRTWLNTQTHETLDPDNVRILVCYDN